MPTLTVEGKGSFQVPAGKRLVNALVDECGSDQLHACGGGARCTTCRVEFVAGEPAAMTQAETDGLAAKGITTPGVRLSCQIACNADMTVRVISRLEGSGRKDCGHRPADEIQPPPAWV
jgi:ferredoxin